VNKKALSLAVCIAMALPTASNALSLGDIESNSSLNQPFEGTIKLLSTSVEEANLLRVKVASPAVFNRVGIDRPAFLNSIRFRTTVKNGKPVIVVRSSQPINEPFLNFLLEVSWPNGQLLKEYTVLLDPPVLVQPDTAIASNAAGVRRDPGRQQRQVYTPPARAAQTVKQQPRRVVRNVAPARNSQLRRPGPPKNASASSSRVRNYRVRRGDTLFKIAKKLGYKGIRKEQMMVALYNKNKRAFSKRNMNNLKAGALLARPSYQEAKSLSSRKAKALVVAQARAWKKGRTGSIARKATRKNSVAAKKVNVNNNARVEVMGGKSSVGAKLNPGGTESATLKELSKQLALTNEALTTRLKENDDLKSRVTELESLLRQKNKLITLKSEQLASLQAKMKGAGMSVPTQSDAEVQVNVPNDGLAIDPSVNNEGTDIQQQVAVEQANERGEIIRDGNGSDQLAMLTDTNPVTNTDEIASNPFKNSADTESDSLDIMGLLSSPAAMGVGGGTLLALLGGLWFMRRRKDGDDKEGYGDFGSIDIDNQMDDMEFDDSALESSSEAPAFDSPFEESEAPESDITIENDVDANSKNALTDGNEQEDILQEADVYIVYGLYDQAESELKRAIDDDPTNLSYRAKLLENYKAAGNKDAFEEEANAFMQLEVDGKDAYLDDITAWGKALLPESKLFDSGNALKMAGAAGVAMVAGTAVANNDKQDQAVEETEELNIEDVLDDSGLSELDNDLDNLDFDDLLSEGEDDDLLGLNDDLDIDVNGLDDLNGLDGIEIGETDADDLLSLGKESEDISDEEFDLEMESTEKLLESVKNDEVDFLDLDNVEAMPKVDIADSTNLDVANLNLDLDSEDFDKIMPSDNAYKKQATNDLEEDNLLADFDDNLSFLDLDDDSEVIEETQIETKLDLARAYIDMGDIEGARSTLEEVLQEGSDEQKREAEDLLHQTG